MLILYINQIYLKQLSIPCWGGNYCFLEGNPKAVFPPNHVMDAQREPRVSEINVEHAKSHVGCSSHCFNVTAMTYCASHDDV